MEGSAASPATEAEACGADAGPARLVASCLLAFLATFAFDVWRSPYTLSLSSLLTEEGVHTLTGLHEGRPYIDFGTPYGPLHLLGNLPFLQGLGAHVWALRVADDFWHAVGAVPLVALARAWRLAVPPVVALYVLLGPSTFANMPHGESLAADLLLAWALVLVKLGDDRRDAGRAAALVWAMGGCCGAELLTKATYGLAVSFMSLAWLGLGRSRSLFLGGLALMHLALLRTHIVPLVVLLSWGLTSAGGLLCWTTPPPVPLPWRRSLPLLLAGAACVAAACAVLSTRFLGAGLGPYAASLLLYSRQYDHDTHRLSIAIIEAAALGMAMALAVSPRSGRWGPPVVHAAVFVAICVPVSRAVAAPSILFPALAGLSYVLLMLPLYAVWPYVWSRLRGSEREAPRPFVVAVALSVVLICGNYLLSWASLRHMGGLLFTLLLAERGGRAAVRAAMAALIVLVVVCYQVPYHIELSRSLASGRLVPRTFVPASFGRLEVMCLPHDVAALTRLVDLVTAAAAPGELVSCVNLPGLHVIVDRPSELALVTWHVTLPDPARRDLRVVVVERGADADFEAALRRCRPLLGDAGPYRVFGPVTSPF